MWASPPDLPGVWTASAAARTLPHRRRTAGEERYGDWPAWVVSGTFTFAATGLDDELARQLLSNSPALIMEYVDDHGN